MRALLSVLVLAALPAFAKGAKTTAYSLSDSEILGKYEITKSVGEEGLDEAELRISEENKLTLYYNSNEYELSGPDKDGVVYDEDDEPNCDGGEEVCMYDVHIKIKLVPADIKGETRPQLQIELTTADAFDEEGKSEETNTYVLNWSKKLANAIPYFTTAKTPRELQAFIDECTRVVAPAVGKGLGREADVCSVSSTYRYREPEKVAINALMKFYSGNSKGIQKVTAAQLKTKVFATAEEKVKKNLKGKETGVSVTDVLAQMRKLQQIIVKYSDLIYVKERKPAYDLVYSVNRSSRTVIIYHIDQ